MNPIVRVQFANPAPEDCPTTFTENVELLNELVSAEIETEIIPYVTGAATPDVDDQDKVWHKQDADGRPLGTYLFYSGAWRRQYTSPIGTVVMYSGDPAVDFGGTDGAGTVGGEWDGWQLCNGLNGSINLSDKFIVGAKMDDVGVGYPAGTGPWKTTVDGTTQQTGGANEITLTADTTYRPAVDAIQMSNWQADGNAPDAGGGLWGLGSGHTLLPADAGNLTPDAIPSLPPYLALAFAVFKGYT